MNDVPPCVPGGMGHGASSTELVGTTRRLAKHHALPPLVIRHPGLVVFFERIIAQEKEGRRSGKDREPDIAHGHATADGYH